MPRPRIATLVMAVAAALVAGTAAAGPWLVGPGEYYSEMQAGRFSANTFYDGNGDRRSTDARFEQRSLTSINEIGWKKWVCVLLSAPAESRTIRLGAPYEYAERTQTGLADIDVGFRFKMMDGPTALALQVDWAAPLGYQTNTIPTLGPGRSSITQRLSFGTGLPALSAFIQADGGIRYWGQIYGVELVSSAQAGAWLGKSLLVSGHYSSEVTLEGADDPIYESNDRIVGPELRYRLDDRFDLIAGSNHTAAGKNRLHTDEIYIAFAFRQTKLGRLQGFTGSKRP